MQIILLDTEDGFLPDTPLALTPLLGKPLLERVYEYWLKRGATRFDVVLAPTSQRVQERLGRGEKWGVPISYHHSLESVRSKKETAVIGRLESFPPPPGLTDIPCLTVSLKQEWSGWAFIAPEQLAELLDGRLPAEPMKVFHPARAVGSREAFLALQLFVLREGCVEAREVAPGVWVAPGAVIHPSARLHPPLYIGKNSLIDAEVSLGPAVVVDRNCLVGKGSDLVDSWVQPRASVKPGHKATGEFISSSSQTGGLVHFFLKAFKQSTGENSCDTGAFKAS